MKIIQLPSSTKKLTEIKRNIEMLDVLIGQYIPEKSKFVKNKIRTEQGK